MDGDRTAEEFVNRDGERMMRLRLGLTKAEKDDLDRAAALYGDKAARYASRCILLGDVLVGDHVGEKLAPGSKGPPISSTKRPKEVALTFTFDEYGLLIQRARARKMDVPTYVRGRLVQEVKLRLSFEKISGDWMM